MATRNLTLSMPEELVKRVKVLAAERDTSVSALVAGLIRQIAGDVDDYETAWATEEQLIRQGILEVGDVTWTRDEVHAR